MSVTDESKEKTTPDTPIRRSLIFIYSYPRMIFLSVEGDDLEI
jgi:hypothetical protein